MRAPHRDRLFWDYACLPQNQPEAHSCPTCLQNWMEKKGPCEKHGRTAEEDERFKKGLRSMAQLYASPHGSSVVLSSEIPPPPTDLVDEYNAHPVDKRGWACACSSNHRDHGSFYAATYPLTPHAPFSACLRSSVQ